MRWLHGERSWACVWMRFCCGVKRAKENREIVCAVLSRLFSWPIATGGLVFSSGWRQVDDGFCLTVVSASRFSCESQSSRCAPCPKRQSADWPLQAWLGCQQDLLGASIRMDESCVHCSMSMPSPMTFTPSMLISFARKCSISSTALNLHSRTSHP